MLIRNSDTPCISFRARCLLFDSPFPPAAEISALSKARITTVAEPKSLRTLLLSASREFIGAVRTCGRACTRVCSQTCTRTRIQASRARFRSHRYSCLTAVQFVSAAARVFALDFISTLYESPPLSGRRRFQTRRLSTFLITILISGTNQIKRPRHCSSFSCPPNLYSWLRHIRCGRTRLAKPVFSFISILVRMTVFRYFVNF